MSTNTSESHRSTTEDVSESETSKRLSEARTPSYDDTRDGDSWPDGGPSLEDYIEAYYEQADADPDDLPSQWDGLPQDGRNWIAAKTLLGDPDADTAEDGVSFAVVYPNGDLSEDGTDSARVMARQPDHSEETAESIISVTERLLEDEFGWEFEDEEDAKANANASPSPEQTRSFTKHVTFKATDEDRQVAIGAALVPNEVDLQGDWLRPETIERIADGYMGGLATGEVSQGVMHVKFDDDDITLVENRVLSEPEVMNGHRFDAGTWIIGYKLHDDALWSLVEDGILTGFSIGGVISEAVSIDPTDAPLDLEVPVYHEDGEPVTEILDADLREVSLVDMPAVPSAQIVETKAVLEKADRDALRDPEVAQQILEDRGHSPGDAARLANYLLKRHEKTATEQHDMSTTTNTTTTETDSTADTVDAGSDAEKADRSDDAHVGDDGSTANDATDTSDTGRESDAEEMKADLDAEDVGFLKRLREFFAGSTSSDEDEDGSAEKAGRTLNNQNRRRLWAAHDAIETALSSGPDSFEGNRFTDNADYDFSLDEMAPDLAASGGGSDSDTSPLDVSETLRFTKGLVDDIEADVESDVDADADADATKLPDETDMSDVTTEQTESNADADAEKADADADGEDIVSDAPEWAKSLHEDITAVKEQTEKNSERLDDVAGDGDDNSESEKDADADADGGEDGDEDAEKESASESPPEWAAAMHDDLKTVVGQVKANTESIDEIGKQSGHSTQASGLDPEAAKQAKKDLAELESEVFD